MTKEHFQIFVFFHSFWVSVKAGWMKKSDDEIKYEKFVKKESKTSEKNRPVHKEMPSQHQIFNVLNNSIKTARQETDIPITSHTHSHLKKPTFMSINNWLSCIQLEKSLPKIFKGLTESLVQESDKWCEYFHCNSSTDANEAKFDIDFLNECPLKNENLDTFYKFILWTTAQSHRLIELIEKFNIYNFGGLIPQPHELNIDSFYQITSQFIPNILFVNKNSKIIFIFFFNLNLFAINF